MDVVMGRLVCHLMMEQCAAPTASLPVSAMMMSCQKEAAVTCMVSGFHALHA